MDSLLALLNRIEDFLDRTKFAIRKKLHLIKPVMVEPYRGYGNRQAVSITERLSRIRAS